MQVRIRIGTRLGTLTQWSSQFLLAEAVRLADLHGVGGLLLAGLVLFSRVRCHWNAMPALALWLYSPRPV